MSRRLSLLVIALATIAVSACSSVTGPDTTSSNACGVYNGTGTKTCD